MKKSAGSISQKAATDSQIIGVGSKKSLTARLSFTARLTAVKKKKTRGTCAVGKTAFTKS